MQNFLNEFSRELLLIAPGLVCGFILSALIHEILPDIWIKENVGKKGLRPILYAAISGTLLPLCTWAEIPLALSFYKKGARLGAVLAFLLTAPATSFISLILAWQMLGIKFFIYIFSTVLLMGIIVGILGNLFEKKIVPPQNNPENILEQKRSRFFRLLFTITQSRSHKKDILGHLKSVFRFSFVDILKEAGPGIFLGITLAAFINTFEPIKFWIKQNLTGNMGYLFAFCLSFVNNVTSNAAVPLASAFLKQGLSSGASMVFLLLSPVIGYGTIIVIKNVFGWKVVITYVGVIAILSLFFGYLFSFL